MHTANDQPKPPTPGAYLRRRRMAAGYTIADLAGLLAAEVGKPVVAQHIRRSILQLEDSTRPAVEIDMDAYERLIRFDRDALDALSRLHVGFRSAAPRLCADCGCSWHRPCVDGGDACGWDRADPTRCTHCADLARAQHRVAA